MRRHACAYSLSKSGDSPAILLRGVWAVRARPSAVRALLGLVLKGEADLRPSSG